MKSALKQKTYPVGYTSKDIEFLKKQKEDVVRYEDLDKKGQEIWKKQGKPVPKLKKKKKTPLEQKIKPYWYKIGGKTVTKAKYNAYENPVGDGPTKTTNDPDASGRIAKREVTRSNNKASKRPTVLTKEQTELKKQGTKLEKKPPLLSKKKFEPHMMYKGKSAIKANTYKKHLELKKKGYGHTPLNYSDSPLHFDWKKALDYGQTALTAAGTIPGFGIVADGINTATSLGRAGYSKWTGDDEGAKEHMINAGVNAAMMVPVVGQGVASTKLAYQTGKEVVKQGGKKLAKEVGDKVVKKAVNKGSKEILKKTDKAVTNKIAENKKKNKPKKNVVYDSTKTVTARKPKKNKNTKVKSNTSKNIA